MPRLYMYHFIDFKLNKSYVRQQLTLLWGKKINAIEIIFLKTQTIPLKIIYGKFISQAELSKIVFHWIQSSVV